MQFRRNGLDNVAMEWIASGLVDDTQLLNGKPESKPPLGDSYSVFFGDDLLFP